MSWAIERATAADADAVEAFLLRIPEFAGTIVPGAERLEWAWLFAAGGGGGALIAREVEPGPREPAGPGATGPAATAPGRVVGHWGVAPFALHHDERIVTAGFLSRLAIDPAFRQTPLFLALSAKLLRAIGDPGFGIDATYTLANRPGILEYLLAFGGLRVGEIPVLAQPVRPERILRRLLPRPLGILLAPALLVAGALVRRWLTLFSSRSPDGLSVREVDLTGAARDRELAALAGIDGLLRERRFAAVRSPERLEARFAAEAVRHRGYRLFRIDAPTGLAGYFVIRRMSMKGFDALAVVDVVLDPAIPDAARSFVASVTRLALASGVELVGAFTNDRRIRRALGRSLFLGTGERFTLVVSRSPTTSLAGSTIEDWHVTWFDHDYV